MPNVFDFGSRNWQQVSFQNAPIFWAFMVLSTNVIKSALNHALSITILKFFFLRTGLRPTKD